MTVASTRGGGPSGWADRLRARLRASPLAANVLRMVAGNAAAQALTLLAYPVLTRLYTPGQIGILSVLMSAVSILAPASALRLEMALPMSRTAREAGSMLVACALALLFTTASVTLAMAVLPGPWPGDMSPAEPYRWFLPVALLAFGSYVVMVHEATRQDRFAPIARTRVYQAISGPACQIGLGWLGVGPLGLLLGYVIGQSSGTVGLARQLLTGASSPLRQWSLRSVRAAVSRHRNFVLFSSWTGVVSAAASYAMTISFAFLYGPAISGFMFLGERVLIRPLFLITSSILPVYTREVARVHQSDPPALLGLFAGVLRKQVLLSLLWIGPIVLAAPHVIPWVFGAAWAESASYVQILAIGYFPTSVLQPVMHTLQVLQQQRLSALLDVIRSAAVLGALGAVAWFGVGPMTAALVCSSVQALAHSA